MAQRSIQISPQILDGLDPHTQAQQRWRQVLLPGNAGPPRHGGLDGANDLFQGLPAGLHLADLEQLLGLLDRLVDSGKSVIVIEHHQAVMAHADWTIDLGPGAGHDGGRIVFEGTPADLVALEERRSTLTGEHLTAFVGGRSKAVRSR